MSETSHILKINCPDRIGLVAKVMSVLLCHGLNVTSNHEFVDPPSRQFFMRAVFQGQADLETIKSELLAVLGENTELELCPVGKKNLALMATKEAHVLGDLLVKCAYGDMEARIGVVIANHDTLRPLVEGFGVPFVHISAEGMTREQHEAKVLAELERWDFDILVLAKYMRILTPEFVRHFPQRIINIHHSFLPAFIGANPYRQAYERGVKVIGATAHFVNHELDEGPIIAQGVEAVDHQLTPKGLAKVGRDIEKATLAKALNKVLEERVLLAGHRTVVF